MKLKLMFMFCLALSIMMGNKLQAQTITFTGPTTINSGSELELTAVGESKSYHIANMPINGYSDYTPFTGTVGNALTYEAYFKSSVDNSPPSRVRYRFTNTSSYPISVKVTFKDVTIRNVDLTSYIVDLYYTVIVNPAPAPVSYANSAQSGSFLKDDCIFSDGPADPVVYTVPAGKYKAASQAAADDLAVADVNRNGQAYANENGKCNSEFTFTVISPNKPDENGQLPPRSQVIATILLPKGTAPVGGVTFEIQVTYPSQTVSTYKSNTARFSLTTPGAYLIKGRITKNATGQVSPWQASVISIR